MLSNLFMNSLMRLVGCLGFLLLCWPVQAQSQLTVYHLLKAPETVSRLAHGRQQDPQEYSKPMVYEGGMFHCKRPPQCHPAPA